MIDNKTKKESLTRLNRIRGQINGLIKMIDSEEYCIDILNQINAVRRALEQVALIVMKRHVESCVAESVIQKKSDAHIKELMSSIDKFIR